MENMINQYLNYQQTLHFKRLIIQAVSDVAEKTDVGYYYTFPDIARLVNSKIDKIWLSADSISSFIELQDKTLILDSSFAGNSLESIIKSEKGEIVMIRLKQIGLRLLSNSQLDPNLERSISLYFSGSKEINKQEFYYRRYNTSLPYFDLTANIIWQLKLFVSDDILAQTLCYGEQTLSKQLDQLSNQHGTLRHINQYLSRIRMIQNKIDTLYFQYNEVENIYIQMQAHIHQLMEEKQISEQQAIEKISVRNYGEMDSKTQRILMNVTRIYDLYEDSIKENFTPNFMQKIETVLAKIKINLNHTFHILDDEYISSNDYIINHLGIKFIKNNPNTDISEFFQLFHYQIIDQYNYLEESKAFKKIKKRLINQ